MKRYFIYLFIIFNLACSMNQFLFGQGKFYEGPDDPAGDIAAEREGYMTGNRVFLYFRNTTELSDWPKVEVSRWPNNYNGVKMTDGIGLLIGAVVFVKNNTEPVTDPSEIATLAAAGRLDTLYFCQTSYREEMDTDPTGTVEWAFYPVFGYFDENSEYPAMSDRPRSWPPNGWPARGRTLKWPGEWDGRFGRGVIYADMETYFVANDAQDQEYLGPEDRVKYYPRPGRKIGDIRPSVTIQKGLPWGGLGLRVEQRGFQWNNPEARDAIFWEYTIANISDYDVTRAGFGYWVDNAIGNDANDELGYFDRVKDLAYSWDIDEVGSGGLITGLMGFAYLESPGKPYDGIDNDDDGIIDEKRDNIAVSKVGPTDGIANMVKFLEFYRLKPEDLKEHWDADEDGDWEDGVDANGDGQYQLNEQYGNDVGLDGVGPADLNYTGPDEGECNHKPDYIQGLGCEPNFAATDVSESDMLGLTSFMLFPVPVHVPPYERWFRNDKSMWEVIGKDSLVEYLGTISNLVETFASSPFPLFQGRTERISMSELHAYDPLTGLQSSDHRAPALFRQKEIVQVIYERDYRFAQPPLMPTLKATAEDGKVILVWDDVADTRTRDPFVGNVNDFEGYKLFKASDKKMQDSEVITDGFGTPMFKKPIFQCDLRDGIWDFCEYSNINGTRYHLGYETGITHHFVDINVENGRTYYYAIVAYDYGAPDIGEGISPSENNIVIELDEAEEIRSIGRNVQIVRPYAKALGYQPPTVDEKNGLTFGSGTIVPEILATKSLKLDHTYKVKFRIDTLQYTKEYAFGLTYTNSGLFVYDVTEGNKLVYQETPQRFAFGNLKNRDTEYTGIWNDYWYYKTDGEISSDIFDGMHLKIKMPTEYARYDSINSGWLKGDSPMNILLGLRESYLFPWDYDIVFTGNDSAYIGRVANKTMLDENNQRVSRSELITNYNFSFYVLNKSIKDSKGAFEVMDLVIHDKNKNKKFDIATDHVLVGPVNSTNKWAGTAFVLDFTSLPDSTYLPKPNDVYSIKWIRPFWPTDSLLITPKATQELDVEEIKEDMDEIRVVPNPYVATNSMETSVANWLLNQRRQIMFTNIPALCTIKIFTVSGVLVDEIQVSNPADQGSAHWNLLTKEGLEIAAGMYLYHVKCEKTGEVKMGKFAVIK